MSKFIDKLYPCLAVIYIGIYWRLGVLFSEHRLGILEGIEIKLCKHNHSDYLGNYK